MANKYLRRCVRRSFFFSSSSSVATPPWWRPAAAAAAHDHCRELVQKRLQGLPHHWSSIQSPPRSAVRDGPLMLHAGGTGRSCLSAALFNSSPVYFSATDEGYVDEGDYISFSGEENLNSVSPSRRSHSRSKLQGKLLPSFLKSFLHHRSSHDHLDSGGGHEYSASCTINHAEEQAAAVHISTEVGSSSSSPSKYTRSWSTPSLIHIHRDILTESKLPQKSCSFRARNLRSRGSSRSSTTSRGKRTPKGHVAVYVEGGNERRAVPIDYLSHPQFEALLERAHNEFGFGQKGGLLLPCSLPELQHTLRSIHTDTIPSCIKLL